jgi:hypothetical protein
MAHHTFTVTISARRGWLYVAIIAHHTAGAFIAVARLCHKVVEAAMRKAAVAEGAR